MGIIDIKRNEVPIRENRLKAITGYVGTIGDLHGQATTCSAQNRERCFTQASACSSGCCQNQLGSITDALVINHAPVGCAADSVPGNVNYKSGARLRGLEYRNVQIISTNLEERDTVFGATEKLRDTILQAYERYKPNAIFVTTSCVSGIIGEDIQSVLNELKDELGIPLVPAFCEGFKTKVWASGFDAAFHAVLHGIVEPPRSGFTSNTVNFVNFRGSARREIIATFAKLGVEPVFLLQHSSVEQIRRISEARATVSICGTLGSYLGNGLEQYYGVSYVKTEQPHGITGYKNWLRSLGDLLGERDAVEAHISAEETRIADELADIRAKLKGKTAVVGMGPSFGHNYTRVLRELGVEVIWAATWHFDQNYDHGEVPESTKRLAEADESLGVSVGDQQNYEIVNLLGKLKPDIYVTRHGGSSVWATKMGIASYMITDEYAAFGFNGILNFGNVIIDKLTNRSLARKLAERIKLPYSDWWISQDSFSLLEAAGGY
ncbi:nitrogenase component 1 [Geobacter sp. SVR]|uniref:nitrogenase component 1 n=1 Tax=Geobacter sp. SVR TaxID=2495594 RepID=UPI00143EFD9C|nr:nitrogenase component 1 [Geobacter sp. SVR]BCS53625.1 nitrogenase [Geobacter sp. SVR]GCF84178.1 nitrogenase [Geobacter sp. SVR]